MRLLLFDIDGTLISGRDNGRRSLEQAFAETFNLPEVPDSRGRVKFHGAIDRVIQREMAEWLAIAPEELEAGRPALEAAYIRRLQTATLTPGSSHLLPGVMRLLEELQRRSSVALALLTGNIEAGARLKLEVHGLNPFFPTGGFGDDGGTRGEVGRIARRRAEALLGRGIPPSEVVVVGDSEEDVRCGRENGFRTLAVGTGSSSPADLAATGPDYLLGDLSDMSEALRCLAVGGTGTA